MQFQTTSSRVIFSLYAVHLIVGFFKIVFSSHGFSPFPFCCGRQIPAVLDAEAMHLIRCIHIHHRAVEVAPFESHEAGQRSAVSLCSQRYTEVRLVGDDIPLHQRCTVSTISSAAGA